ncbi:MAG: DUF4364 family protein, partial [Bacillota bacterium]|nr:DUF4364 family protein [Bacillota bacterium]
NLDLFDFQLYVPDDIQANIVKKNFHENPERFYKIVLAALTKNKDAVADALKEIDSNLNNELKKQV